MKYHLVYVILDRITKKFSVMIKHDIVEIEGGSIKAIPNKFGFMYYSETKTDTIAVKKLIKFMIDQLEKEKVQCDHIIGELQDTQQLWLIKESKKRRGVKSD